MLQAVVAKLVEVSPETQGHANWTLPVPSLHGTGVAKRRGDGGL